MTAQRDPRFEVVERIMTILSDGSFTATYKYAVLLALIDLCVEQTSASGEPPTSVTTKQLARRIVELYWPQTRPFAETTVGAEPIAVLRQSTSGDRKKGGAAIVRMIWERRRESGFDSTRGVFAEDDESVLLDDIEWKLIEMPLPKLQRVNGKDTDWLYEIAWDDAENAPTRSAVRSYQRDELGAFDNTIRFRPHVAEALSQLHVLLRPFIHHEWTSMVAKLNNLPSQLLSDFLFGADRRSLAPVRPGLVALQDGRCFYCQEPLARHTDIDHFVPFARHPNDSLANLVATHSRCNNAKRDFLAATPHVERWRGHLNNRRDDLLALADETNWLSGFERSLGIARANYFRLPDDARLWLAAKQMEAPDPARLTVALQ